MPPDLSWLPERHLSVVATLAHADELFTRLTDVLYDYQAANPLSLHEMSDGRVSRTIVTAVAPLPRAIPLYVADVLTTLRAAVEHTLYAEVEHASGAPLTTIEARSVEMPALDTAEKFDKWVANRKARAPKPLRLRSPLLPRMRELQPYRLSKSPHEHPMARLAAYTNLAKHRMPAVAALRVAAVLPDQGNIDPRVRLADPVEAPVKVGDVLAEVPLGLRVPVTLFPTIGLNRPGTNQWPILVKELDDLATWVRTQAVPILITGTPDVDRLPASFNVAIGHDDERAAIDGGTDVTAENRHSKRLHVAGARSGLAETLELHPDKPNRESVARWVATLDDEAVLEHMARLIPGTTARHLRHLKDVTDDMLTEMREALEAHQGPDPSENAH